MALDLIVITKELMVEHSSDPQLVYVVRIVHGAVSAVAVELVLSSSMPHNINLPIAAPYSLLLDTKPVGTCQPVSASSSLVTDARNGNSCGSGLGGSENVKSSRVNLRSWSRDLGCLSLSSRSTSSGVKALRLIQR